MAGDRTGEETSDETVKLTAERRARIMLKMVNMRKSSARRLATCVAAQWHTGMMAYYISRMMSLGLSLELLREPESVPTIDKGYTNSMFHSRVSPRSLRSSMSTRATDK
jgi:hypothetical protein